MSHIRIYDTGVAYNIITVPVEKGFRPRQTVVRSDPYEGGTHITPPFLRVFFLVARQEEGFLGVTGTRPADGESSTIFPTIFCACVRVRQLRHAYSEVPSSEIQELFTNASAGSLPGPPP